MSFDHWVQSGGKMLRCGYTTGSCAALAALGASRLLLGLSPGPLSLLTPAGLPLTVEPARLERRGPLALCAVRKDGGDDIDVTSGLLIWARVRRIPRQKGDKPVQILGGPGVGTVTKPGLDQPVGSPAINRVPRQMIEETCLRALEEAHCPDGLEVTIFVPGGEAAAQKTFNPRLGIQGGISILGTSGVVRPQSLAALLDSIRLEIRQQAALGQKSLILVPGNYGAEFLSRRLPGCGAPVVTCSNFLGESLDAAALSGFEAVLFVGHIGKLVKLAGGIMDTHSRTADCRAELFTAHAALAGAGPELSARLMGCATCDACLEELEAAGLAAPVLESLLAKIEYHLAQRAGGRCLAGAWLFSLSRGSLGLTPAARQILQREEFSWKTKPSFTG